MQLYGFISKEEQEMFELLIGVSGIGPKGALGILSALSMDTLRFAIYAQDAKTIAKAPGIGIKTAQKMILELKVKFRLQILLESSLLWFQLVLWIRKLMQIVLRQLRH